MSQVNERDTHIKLKLVKWMPILSKENTFFLNKTTLFLRKPLQNNSVRFQDSFSLFI